MAKAKVKDKPRKRYVKRAPLGKILGAVLGAGIATQGRVFGLASSAIRGDMDSVGRHIEDIQTHFDTKDVGAGIVVALVGTEISKANSKYLGLKANLPLGLKVRL